MVTLFSWVLFSLCSVTGWALPFQTSVSIDGRGLTGGCEWLGYCTLSPPLLEK